MLFPYFASRRNEGTSKGDEGTSKGDEGTSLRGPWHPRTPDASRRVSTFAADYLGLPERGRLAPGAWGDVVVLDRDLQLTDVFVEGVSIGAA